MRKREQEAARALAYHEVVMPRRLPGRLVPRMLFGFAVVVSASLLGLVVLAPVLQRGRESGRVLTVFAHDATLRRTGIAVAIGLLATACIFFRHPFGTPHHRLPRVPPPRRDHGF